MCGELLILAKSVIRHTQVSNPGSGRGYCLKANYHASILNFKVASAKIRFPICVVERMVGRQGGVKAGLAVASYLIANDAMIAPAESAITSQNKWWDFFGAVCWPGTMLRAAAFLVILAIPSSRAACI